MKLLDPKAYTIAWIAPLEIEARAALVMFDKHHQGRFPVNRGDDYVYEAGEMCNRNVIIATLPRGQVYGKGSAAAIASQVKKFFPNLWIGFLVGVAAGLPNWDCNPPVDIRLGDVLVGLSESALAGLIDYDLGKETDNGFQLLQFDHALAQTHPLVRSAIGSIMLKAPDDVKLFLPYYDKFKNERHRYGSFADPGQETDLLYRVNDDGNEHLIPREPRPDHSRTRVWYGPIGSSDKVMKNARKRNELRDRYNIIGLEMEAAGMINHIPIGVIRGVCDYGDKHKNKQWQPYAAAMAASYAKAVLAQIPPKEIEPVDEQLVENNIKLNMSSLSQHLFGKFSSSARVDDPNTPVSPATPPDGVLHTREKHSIDNQRKAVLASLQFDKMEDRFNSIHDAYGETCQWLSATSEYLDWLDPHKLRRHHGFLWIKGHPGAGKSTLMKAALESIQKIKGSNCISFFFNARGSGLAKSTNGMYRSLLWQLLTKLPHLESILDSPGRMAQNNIIPKWSTQLLKSLFKQAVLDLKQSPVICLIDALDECDDSEIREMVSFFQDLGQTLVSSNILFRVCLSSRYFPHITISKGLNLELGRQTGHTQDIVNYIDGNLRIENITLAPKVRKVVLKKASGVFMWVILVVDILQREHDKGHTDTLLQRLQDIPEELDELFRKILMRDHHTAEMLLCIQWVLFATQPLRTEELYSAIRVGIDTNAILNWNPKHVDDSDMRRYILNSSKGLVEITMSKENPTAQFIHESVREYFSRESFTTIWPELKGNFRGNSHERLKQCCVEYMKIGTAYLATKGHLSHITQAKQIRRTTEAKFPFLKYASHSILHHAEEAAASGIGQASFLENFDVAGWATCNLNFGKVVSHQHLRTTSLLYVLAERNAANLIGYHKDKLCGFEEEEEAHYRMPILAAIILNKRQAVYALLKAQADTQPSSSPLYKLCEQYSQSEQRQRTLSSGFQFQKRDTLLSNLFCAGDDVVTAFLLAAPSTLIKNIKRDITERTELLCRAAEVGHEALVRQLLNQGVKIDDPARRRSTALWLAANGNHTKIAQLLLDSGANTEVPCYLDGETALHTAVMRQYTSMVRLLLKYNASVYAHCCGNKTPLHYAVEEPNSEIIQLLLKNNANKEAIEEYGCTPLLLAVKLGNATAVKLLISEGASIEATYSTGRTPLAMLVANRDHWLQSEMQEVIQVLLDKGANINAADRSGNTPLSLANALPEDDPVKRIVLSNAAEKGSRI